jgi:hypothetical protein
VVKAMSRPLYPRERDPVATVQESGWVSGPVWRGKEKVAQSGFESRTVQHAANHHTDYAILYAVLFLKSNLLACNRTGNFRIHG